MLGAGLIFDEVRRLDVRLVGIHASVDLHDGDAGRILFLRDGSQRDHPRLVTDRSLDLLLECSLLPFSGPTCVEAPGSGAVSLSRKSAEPARKAPVRSQGDACKMHQSLVDVETKRVGSVSGAQNAR